MTFLKHKNEKQIIAAGGAQGLRAENKTVNGQTSLHLTRRYNQAGVCVGLVISQSNMIARITTPDGATHSLNDVQIIALPTLHIGPFCLTIEQIQKWIDEESQLIHRARECGVPPEAVDRFVEQLKAGKIAVVRRS